VVELFLMTLSRRSSSSELRINWSQYSGRSRVNGHCVVENNRARWEPNGDIANVRACVFASGKCSFDAVAVKEESKRQAAIAHPNYSSET